MCYINDIRYGGWKTATDKVCVAHTPQNAQYQIQLYASILIILKAINALNGV